MEIIAENSVLNSTDAFQISNIDIRNASFKFINLSSANKNSWNVPLRNKLAKFSPRVNNNVIIMSLIRIKVPIYAMNVLKNEVCLFWPSDYCLLLKNLLQSLRNTQRYIERLRANCHSYLTHFIPQNSLYLCLAYNPKSL